MNHFETPFAYHNPPTRGVSPIIAKKIIIFGSASNVEERLDWHEELAKEISRNLEQGVPVMGICFGHQLMADFYGGKVDFNPHRKMEDGHRKVTFEKDWMSFKKGDVLKLFKRHEQQITHLPDCFEVIASSPECPFDIVKHKTLPYFSCQTHPEASQDFLDHNIDLEIDSLTKEEVFKNGIKLIAEFLK
ncbi:gamma-glutamyl-gamma-aminobutyrate hydrolase family protein [Bacteriovoracaceae bacterium]|nr:gamma-glutamyl-gamma-aminobutyrate hydrolase family protein [Bacteriovoracaceae bacterium]